jgi:hypothetical protein
MTTARALLDAHVRFEVERLTGPALATTIAEIVDDVLEVLGEHQLDDLLVRDGIADAATTLLTTAGSPLAAGLVEMATELVHSGEIQLPPLAEVADRDTVESLVTQVLALSPLLERALDRLTESPLVGTVAARFMGRIVSEVVATNQEIANKVPGLGSLVSFGTSAANLVKGAADKPFEALLGSSVAKGGSSFAVRRLNRILIDTLNDPVTHQAVLQVWDLVSTQPVNGLGDDLSLEDATALTATLHELGLGALEHEVVPQVVRVVVDAFLDRFGGYTPPELLEQLDLSRNDLVAHLAALAPQVVTELHAAGHLERLVRSRLAPFYESEAAKALLTS